MIDFYWLPEALYWEGFQDEAGTQRGKNDMIN